MQIAICKEIVMVFFLADRYVSLVEYNYNLHFIYLAIFLLQSTTVRYVAFTFGLFYILKLILLFILDI